MRKYLLLAALVPFLELFLLFQLGRVWGLLPVVALVLLSAVLGARLARREGLRVLATWQSLVAQGRVPEEGLLGAALVALGGVLLVVPGLLTDVAGVLLLLPPTRRWVSARIRRRLEGAVASGRVRVVQVGRGAVRDVGGVTRTVSAPRSRLPSSAAESDAEWVPADGPER